MIVAGFGFRTGASAASLADALARAGAGRRVDRLAAPEDKSQADALRQLAERTGLPVAAIGAAALTAVETATRSPAALAARGTGSVAEAAALAGAGRGARLLAPRVISRDRAATCAIAEGEGP